MIKVGDKVVVYKPVWLNKRKGKVDYINETFYRVLFYDSDDRYEGCCNIFKNQGRIFSNLETIELDIVETRNDKLKELGVFLIYNK